MSVREILIEARDVHARAPAHVRLHTLGLAYAQDGQHVRPTDPTAATWTSVGALGKVATVDRKPWCRLSFEGDQAYMLLEDAARQQGHGEPAFADIAGPAAVARMFARAIQLAPEDRRRRGVRR